MDSGYFSRGCRYKDGERVVCIDNYEIEGNFEIGSVHVVEYGPDTDDYYINGYYELL